MTPFEAAVSRQERPEEQQDFDSELDVSPRIGVEEEATRRFEELPEPPPRAVTQREHVRQRAQQGVPIPRESFVWDGDTWQDRRFSQEPLYVMPRQTALVKQPSALPAPQERPQHSVLSAPQEGPSPPLLPRSQEVRLATALRRERVLRRWQAFIYRYCVCGVRVLRNGLRATTLSSGEVTEDMVDDEGGAVLILPVCVSCKRAPATEICLGHLCRQDPVRARRFWEVHVLASC